MIKKLLSITSYKLSLICMVSAITCFMISSFFSYKTLFLIVGWTFIFAQFVFLCKDVLRSRKGLKPPIVK